MSQCFDTSDFQMALRNFQSSDPKNSSILSDRNIAKSADPAIDAYFSYVARTGRSSMNWTTIRPAFLWKLQATMIAVQTLDRSDSQTGKAIDEKNLLLWQERILETAREFTGIPFTFQRLCELLTDPRKYYKKIDKFLRALEKNINIVTTVTPNGNRVTGPEPVHNKIKKIDEMVNK